MLQKSIRNTVGLHPVVIQRCLMKETDWRNLTNLRSETITISSILIIQIWKSQFYLETKKTLILTSVVFWRNGERRLCVLERINSSDCRLVSLISLHSSISVRLSPSSLLSLLSSPALVLVTSKAPSTFCTVNFLRNGPKRFSIECSPKDFSYIKIMVHLFTCGTEKTQ